MKGNSPKSPPLSTSEVPDKKAQWAGKYLKRKSRRGARGATARARASRTTKTILWTQLPTYDKITTVSIYHSTTFIIL